jgi:O-antigen ligase
MQVFFARERMSTNRHGTLRALVATLYPGGVKGAGTDPADMTVSRAQRIWRTVVGVGLAWMMLGLVVMPSGVSFNPGRIYQGSLIALLYLPALCLACVQGRRWARALLPLPLFRVFIALLAWAVLSLLWSQARHPGDELARLLSLLTFVLGWLIWAGSDRHRGHGLLLLAGVGMALVALVYCIRYMVTPPLDDRIVGDGVIATANYAAGVMGAACVWLSQLTVRDWRISAGRWLALLALLLFVALTHSRSVWLALVLCVLLAPLWQPTRQARWYAGIALVLVVLAFVWPVSLLLDRGTSLRPELFLQSLHLIGHQPWLGLGAGTTFELTVAGQNYTHSHNVLTQMAITLGLPGVALIVALWLMVGWQGWRYRRLTTGRVILALWVYASVVLQFDMPQLLSSPRPGWLLVWLPFALALGLLVDERRVAGGATAPASRLH